MISTPTAAKLGVVEWFRPGEETRVERVVARLAEVGINHLRTAVSWADWHTPEGEKWYSWLLPTLRDHVELLPCFLYTPPSLGVMPRAAAPPREPRAFADFLDVAITEFGDCFDMVELWNEPNNLSEYDWTLDPDWRIFCEMIGGAAYWAKQRGKQTVLGGMSPADPNWVRVIGCHGVLQYIDVVGIHGFPGTWELAWQGWPYYIDETRQVLNEHSCDAQIWITETGFSTWRHDLRGQLHAFTQALDAPVERVYWYGMEDLSPEHATVDGFHSDERDYHFGLNGHEGQEKLLFRMLREEGIKGVRELSALAAPQRPVRHRERRTLITGGAGFIGCNLAHRLLSKGHPVVLFDNLARPGVERNLRWLADRYGDLLSVHLGDVRDPIAVRRALDDVETIYHLAGQVAVTSSLADPASDFLVNGQGTLNVLEEARRLDDPPAIIFTSTNKVYGALEHLSLRLAERRYQPTDLQALRYGIGEDCVLDFHSPYGCSKGTADQYVLDYARSFGLQSVVFRMSCIYGPHQMGTEDQGWVAHFLLQALRDEPITIYGDGCQVRDILYVEDLVDGLLKARRNIRRISGQAFNIGGGPENTVSLLELVDRISDLRGRRPAVVHDNWRVGDQRYYVSDTRAFSDAVKWSPRVKVGEGLRQLHAWLMQALGPEADGLAKVRNG